MPDPLTDKLLRISEVARILTISRGQIYKMMNEGGFPAATYIAGKSPRWPSSQVAEWLQARRDAAAAGNLHRGTKVA